MTFVRLNARIARQLVIRRLVAPVCAVAMLAVAAAPSFAQRGRSIPGLGRSGLGNNEPEISVPKQVNAVNLLIEHRQELALSDSQLARVVVIKRSLDSSDLPLLRKLDSVQRLFKTRSMFQDESAARRDSIALARALVRDAVALLGENISDARAQAFGLLSAQQLPKAEQLASAAQQALDEERRESPSGGRGGGRGPAPSG
jgi:hypothetical protein